MKVSLKKANELQRLALETANKLSVSSNVNVSIYTEGQPEDFIPVMREVAIAKIDATMSNSISLIDAGFMIRHLLGEENAKAVNQLLNERACLEAKEKRLNVFLTSLDVNESVSGEVIARVNSTRKLLENGTDRHYVEKSFDMHVVSEDMRNRLQDELLDLRRLKSEITDKLAGINLNYTITLPSGVVQVLKDNKLL